MEHISQEKRLEGAVRLLITGLVELVQVLYESQSPQPQPASVPHADQMERLVSAQELADVLRVPRAWVYEQVRKEALPYMRVGRYLRFDPDAVLDHYKGQQQSS